MKVLARFTDEVRLVQPDIVVVIEDGIVQSIHTTTRNQIAAVIDLGAGDVGDVRDYEFVRDNPDFETIYG